MRIFKLCLFFLLFTYSSFSQKASDIEMVHVKGGEFQMGCTEKQYKCKDSEKPAHTVEVNDFYLSKYEITNAQYCHFLNDVEANPGGSYYGYEYIQVSSENCMIKYKDGQFKVINDKENHPVVEVTWYGAKAFCHWADGRLPSEAEWEYAARGGNPNKEYIFSGSDTISKVAWFKHNYYTGKNNKFEYREGTLEIGLKEANSLGLHDMSGNVWEFCNDWYSENYYKESPKDNPTGPSHSNYRVKRGGSYKDEALECRISNRRGTLPGYSKSDIGFRLCRDVEKNSINQNNEALSSQ